MNPKITLTNPTDDELNAAVAEYVAGWKDPITLFAWHDRKARQRPLRYYKERPKVNGFTPLGDYSAFVTESGDKVYCGTPFAVHPLDKSFATSADAVLPLLAAHTKRTNELRGGEGDTWKIHAPAGDDDDWSVCPIWMHHDGWVEEIGMMGEAPTFPRAACIALLRANGVEVVT